MCMDIYLYTYVCVSVCTCERVYMYEHMYI